VALPPVAVIEGGGAASVMVVAQGRAARRAVTVGLRGDALWEVDGVSEGDSVVVEGQFGLPDGAAVEVLP